MYVVFSDEIFYTEEILKLLPMGICGDFILYLYREICYMKQCCKEVQMYMAKASWSQ